MLNCINYGSLSCICNYFVLYYGCFQCIPVCFRANFRRLNIYTKTRGWSSLPHDRTRNNGAQWGLVFEIVFSVTSIGMVLASVFACITWLPGRRGICSGKRPLPGMTQEIFLYLFFNCNSFRIVVVFLDIGHDKELLWILTWINDFICECVVSV